jgi:hypothetical protein
LRSFVSRTERFSGERLFHVIVGPVPEHPRERAGQAVGARNAETMPFVQAAGRIVFDHIKAEYVKRRNGGACFALDSTQQCAPDALTTRFRGDSEQGHDRGSRARGFVAQTQAGEGAQATPRAEVSPRGPEGRHGPKNVLIG